MFWFGEKVYLTYIYKKVYPEKRDPYFICMSKVSCTSRYRQTNWLLKYTSSIPLKKRGKPKTIINFQNKFECFQWYNFIYIYDYIIYLKSFFSFQNYDRIPWFVRQWRIPLNRLVYTAFSYLFFLLFITLYVAEVQAPTVHWIDCLTAVWIVSYSLRDMGTGRY